VSATITRRLTVGFACVMAIVLLGGGAGVYFGERFSLDRGLRRDLARQGDEVKRLVAQPRALTSESLRDRRDSYIQILDPQGHEIAATPPLRGKRLLDQTQLAEAARGVHTFERGSITTRNEHTFRIRTEALRGGTDQRIVVVAARRDARDEALRELLGQLAGFGALAFALTVLIGYRLTRRAIQPVEDIRRQADALYRGETHGALEVPATGDELAALTTTLNQLLDRVQQAVERERAFSSAASHELRTPLTALKAELELALRSPRSHEQLLSALREASADTERLIRLTEDLLLLRTPDTGIPREVQPIDDTVRMAVGRRDVDVEIDERAADSSYCGSRELMARAIENLLDNASRHAAGDVRLRVDRDADEIHIEVTDGGPGFPDDLLTTAFEPFRRGPGQRSGTGVGLGLAIVEAIIRAHDGTVTAVNGPPTVVRLSLPAHRPADEGTA
jgi:signal transduction histidine kinase